MSLLVLTKYSIYDILSRKPKIGQFQAIGVYTNIWKEDVIMKTILTSQTSRWYWSRLGMWQFLATLSTLAYFFIILHLTDDRDEAASGAFISASFAAIAFIAMAIIADDPVIFATFMIAVIAIIADDPVTFASFAAIAAIVAYFAVASAVNNVTKHGDIRKRVVWLSFAAEFIIILLPIRLFS